MTCLIYKLICLSNNKAYIGFTSKPIECRWRLHIASSLNPKTLLHKAISKYRKKLSESAKIGWLKRRSRIVG